MTETDQKIFTSSIKEIKTPEYNQVMNMKTGFMARWGKNKDDDPKYSPIGPELIDMEVSTICHGINKVPCSHCYKGNTGIGENMSYDTFKSIFDKLPMNVSQIAFGIGDIDANTDLWSMMAYCRMNGANMVVPNITINGFGLTNEYAKALSILCGAVSVSRYDDKDCCYEAIKKLTDLGMTQVNIHLLVSEETIDRCYETIDDAVNDPRLSKLNSIVLLTLKPKGCRNKLNVLKQDSYSKLIDDMLKMSEEKKVKVGFDSCSAPKFLEAVKDHPKLESFKTMVEPCESTLFSIYINVKGEAFPCSFMEGEEGWIEGIDTVDCFDFLNDVWYNDRIKSFRKSLMLQSGDCRTCPYFNIY